MFSYNFFDNNVSYRLVSVVHNHKMHCGSYNKSADEESITCLESGEKFYSIPDFMRHHCGLCVFNENYDFSIYEDRASIWLPLFMWVQD